MISFPTFNFILAKIRKSIRSNFCYVFVQMSGKYRKYLAHIGTPANVQNNIDIFSVIVIKHNVNIENFIRQGYSLFNQKLTIVPAFFKIIIKTKFSAND